MPAVSVAKTTEAKSMAKPVKEKKPKAPKAASPASHPPYFEMIKDAIVALHERTGSSSYAIAKHMEDKHKGHLPANFKKILANKLKGFAAKGKLVKVKASFKLSEAGKAVKDKKPVAKKVVKKPVAEKAKKPKKAEAVKAGMKRKAPAASAVAKPKKKVVTLAKSPKKVAKSLAKPKKPMTIKSLAAKKARVSKA
ncbi:Histone H1 [Rhynchospora pubera]|uniref:Histone H1 n=1 Tax=Rhynchospora pubera TaxID=906938 RepID=A0AAV8BWC2_9POAL|nr:Histone H1 [Rhynchospora pubera]